VLPEQDAVITITAEISNMQDELNLVWKHLLPSIHPQKIPANEAAAQRLYKQLSSLSLPLHTASNHSPIASAISGKTYIIGENENHIKSLVFGINDNLCHLTINADTATYQLSFSSRDWQTGETTKPGPYLLAKAKARFAGLPPFKIAGNYSWKDSNTIELTLRYIESPHSEKIICHFNKNKIVADFKNSISQSNKEFSVQGELSK
jgi:hypothetical protein